METAGSVTPHEPGVLHFQLFGALGIRDAHAAELTAPPVVAGFRESVLSVQLSEVRLASASLRRVILCFSVNRFFISKLTRYSKLGMRRNFRSD